MVEISNFMVQYLLTDALIERCVKLLNDCYFVSWLCSAESTFKLEISSFSFNFERTLARHLKRSNSLEDNESIKIEVSLNEPSLSISNATPIDPTTFHRILSKWMSIHKQFQSLSMQIINNFVALPISVCHCNEK